MPRSLTHDTTFISYHCGITNCSGELETTNTESTMYMYLHVYMRVIFSIIAVWPVHWLTKTLKIEEIMAYVTTQCLNTNVCRCTCTSIRIHTWCICMCLYMYFVKSTMYVRCTYNHVHVHVYMVISGTCDCSWTNWWIKISRSQEQNSFQVWSPSQGIMYMHIHTCTCTYMYTCTFIFVLWFNQKLVTIRLQIDAHVQYIHVYMHCVYTTCTHTCTCMYTRIWVHQCAVYMHVHAEYTLSYIGVYCTKLDGLMYMCTCTCIHVHIHGTLHSEERKETQTQQTTPVKHKTKLVKHLYPALRTAWDSGLCLQHYV